MRISDWSSDVCSSDLARVDRTQLFDQQFAERGLERSEPLSRMIAQYRIDARIGERGIDADEVARLGTSFEPRGFGGQRLGVGLRLPHLLHHRVGRSEEPTSELPSLMRISYAVFCLNKKNQISHKKYSL